MDLMCRFVVLSFLLARVLMHTNGVIFHLEMPPPSALARQLQTEENRNDSLAVKFGRKENAARVLMNESAGGLSELAIFIEALASNAIANSAPSVDSKQSSTFDRSDFIADGGDNGIEDERAKLEENVNTSFPKLENDASASLDQMVGPVIDASGGTNMTNRGTSNGSIALSQSLCLISTIITLFAFLMVLQLSREKPGDTASNE